MKPRFVLAALALAKGAAETIRLDSLVAAQAPQAPERAALQAAVVLHKRLKLARDIRTPRVYVGFSVFILCALRFAVRPFMWEGANRVDIVHAFASWQAERCQERCSVDGVCCC